MSIVSFSLAFLHKKDTLHKVSFWYYFAASIYRKSKPATFEHSLEASREVLILYQFVD